VSYCEYIFIQNLNSIVFDLSSSVQIVRQQHNLNVNVRHLFVVGHQFLENVSCWRTKRTLCLISGHFVLDRIYSTWILTVE
jgi:hypothetical protein